MEKLLDGIAELVLARGFDGAIIASLAWVSYRFYTRNQELHETMNKLAVASVEAQAKTAAAIDKMVDILRLRGKV